MRGRLRLQLCNHSGELIDVREAHNAVMRSGADLIARLFSGQGTPITHMGVGVSSAPESDDYATEALTSPGEGDDALAGATRAAIDPAAFVLAPDPTRRVIAVKVRATLAADQAVGTIREAGLLAQDGDAFTLYNRVIFAPLTKGDDHELTLLWEVSFPYGDLDAMF